jgi:hypothetical protein
MGILHGRQTAGGSAIRICFRGYPGLRRIRLSWPGACPTHRREAMTRERRQLRFGVMCTGTTFTAWEAECRLDRLVALENTRLALLIIDKRAEAPRARPGPVDRVRSLLRSDRILWLLYEHLLVGGRIKALEPVDWSARLQGVSVLACDVSRRGSFSEYFSASDIEIIRGHDLDFILRFAFGIVRGEILRAPRHEVWSFHRDDEMRYRGGPPAFWEIYRGDPHTGVAAPHREARWRSGFEKARFRHGATFVHQKTGMWACSAAPLGPRRSVAIPWRERTSISMAHPRPRPHRSFTPRVIAKCCASQ